MQEVLLIDSIIHSARTVGGGAGSVVIAAARQMLAACNAARYSE